MEIMLCDDNEIFLNDFTCLLNEEFNKHKCIANLTLCENYECLKMKMNEKRFDLIFLDIDMPRTNGFKIAEYINSQNNGTLIVFVSNLDHLVFNSFNYQPFWFLRKGHMDELPSMVLKIISYFNNKNKFYLVVANNKTISILLDDIIYFENDSHYINLYTIQDRIRYKYRIGDVERELSKSYFARCHAGFVVNCKYIKVLNKEEILLYNNKSIPVSRSRLPNTEEMFMDYIRSIR